MINATDLVALSDAYREANPVPEGTLSRRVFDDGKKIAQMREGKDLLTARYREAVLWFDRNWPERAVWPNFITRPSMAVAA